MESFLKRVLTGKHDADSHRYFIRFGKGNYARRFLLSFAKGTKLKVKGSFEMANDFVKFVKENKDVKFSGSILTKSKIAGKEGKKKAGVFAYEIVESSIKEFENAYFYLLNVDDGEIKLRIKKALPKPGKDADKIDDSFCLMELDLKYWPKIKEAFFWDVPECKKAIVEHELKITDIEIPSGEKDPVKMRELARRKGIAVRKITADGNVTLKDYKIEA